MKARSRERKYQWTGANNPGWAMLILADGEKYRGLLRTIALEVLHNAGEPHPEIECTLCRQAAIANQ